ncbi:hypothetical protein OK016_28265 [Vibrio chagasii]|nr:hypothetical protein [Vibrio chagasii]
MVIFNLLIGLITPPMGICCLSQYHFQGRDCSDI